MTHIREATSSEDYEVAQRLFQSYARSLDFDLDFLNFTEEVATLPGCYSPPAGCIFLATHRDQSVGCVALRPLEPRICEMKRLFALPEFRGMGIGRALAQAVIAHARKLGYERMRLDTVASMRAANLLYVCLGFRPTEPYCHNPQPDASFYELKL